MNKSQKVNFTYNKESLSILGVRGDHIISRIEKNKNFYEEEMLQAISDTSAGGYYVDVGANIGNHTIFMAKFTNAAKVLSFEPNKLAHKYLKKNVKKNNIGNKVQLFELALGAEEGKGSPRITNSLNLGASTFDISRKGRVRIAKLDDMVPLSSKVGLIKIDVEGLEAEVLKGARSTIKDNLPELFIEAQDESMKREIEKEILPYGYKLIKRYNFTPTYHYSAI